MRKLSFWLLLLALPVTAQVQNWDPEPYRDHGGIRFNDDLDFYLNGYTQGEIKAMRQQVSMWRMNFDKMIKATVRDIQAYSEGANMPTKPYNFTLPDVRTGKQYHLGDHNGKLRAFMFGSITNPPSRAQLPFWDALLEKYDTAKVELFVIYGKELHPADKKRYKAYPVPGNMEQKRRYATEFAALTKLPVLIDGLDDKALNAYGRVPNGAYVIDEEGRLIFRGTWADSRKIEHILETVLKWEADGKPRLKAKP
ncbi:MAG TPA: hypothetical protein PKD45_05645 [Flavobacteriales bacterium]|nr:hypothetical protein [Flavobacteriales bacterium]